MFGGSVNLITANLNIDESRNYRIIYDYMATVDSVSFVSQM